MTTARPGTFQHGDLMARVLVILVLLLQAGATQASGGEVVNGNFEHGFYDWEVRGEWGIVPHRPSGGHAAAMWGNEGTLCQSLSGDARVVYFNYRTKTHAFVILSGKRVVLPRSHKWTSHRITSHNPIARICFYANANFALDNVSVSQ